MPCLAGSLTGVALSRFGIWVGAIGAGAVCAACLFVLGPVYNHLMHVPPPPPSRRTRGERLTGYAIGSLILAALVSFSALLVAGVLGRNTGVRVGFAGFFIINLVVLSYWATVSLHHRGG